MEMSVICGNWEISNYLEIFDDLTRDVPHVPNYGEFPNYVSQDVDKTHG